ncbi:MAG: hypothetical protein LBP55_09365 [Candidatus Adiutrix sp.]|jgi:septal ring factor EnvC (AmiA/AmiB activator)|nr:hypothetical protein [Candidatus Adiutrix sp.]
MIRSKLWLPALGLALMSLAPGCATTGDPNAGGLFGWSEAKALDRQASARATLEHEKRTGENIRAEQQKLQSQINAKKKQLTSLRQQSGSKATGSQAAAENARQARLLEQEIDQLTRDSLALSEL